MILTKDEFNSMGFRASTEIQGAYIEQAISEAEMYLLKGMLGSAVLIELASTDHDAVVMKGGVMGDMVTPGMLKAIGHLAYSCLLRHDIIATAFGSRSKTDEHSVAKDPWDAAKYNETIGRQYVREIATAKGWSFTAFGVTTQSI